jgi:hypothetical protein
MQFRGSVTHVPGQNCYLCTRFVPPLLLTIRCCPTRFARLPYVLGPSVTPLAEPRKRVRRQGLALRVTRLFCRGRDASPNASFCHAHVVYFDSENRRATATGTLWDNAPFGTPAGRRPVTRAGGLARESRRRRTYFVSRLRMSLSNASKKPVALVTNAK